MSFTLFSVSESTSFMEMACIFRADRTLSSALSDAVLELKIFTAISRIMSGATTTDTLLTIPARIVSFISAYLPSQRPRIRSGAPL